MSDPYVGEIAIFAGNFAPQGWAFCDGRLLPIQQYTPLFSIISTMYGGDGRTNFALPDLRGRCVLGMGSGPGLTPRALAGQSGYEKVGLGLNELATHNHTAQSTAGGSLTAELKGVQDAGDLSSPQDAYIAAHDNAFKKSGTVAALKSGAVTIDSSTSAVTTNVGNTGSSAQHENMHPFLVVNYIIALQGIYPPRE